MSILPEFLRRLGELGLPVNCHDRYTTARIRNSLNSPKTHVKDTPCLGIPVSIERSLDAMTMVSVTDHGDRQMLRPTDRHGNPRGQGYRRFCALARQAQRSTRYQGHRAHQRRLGSIPSGGLMRFRHHIHGPLTGCAAPDK